MIRSFTAYQKGAVRLFITGEYPERFINFCLMDNIHLWGVTKQKKQLLLWTYLSDFKKIRHVVQKSKVKIKVVERYGMPFLLKRLRRRKTLLAGAVVFLLVIYWLSGYLLFMDVQGLKKIPTHEFQAALSAEGFKVGTRLEDIDETAIAKKLSAEFPAIAWVGIRFTGTKGFVEVVEKADEFAGVQAMGDLVAAKDGLITECIALAGESVVNVGDAVKEGDVLIRGVRRENSEDAVHAEGIVKARVSYVSYGEAQRKKYLYERTGESDFSVRLVLDDHCIRVKDANTATFPAYEIEHLVKKEDGWRNSRFAVELFIDVYHELAVELEEVEIEEAKRTATVNALTAGGEIVPEDAYVLNREPVLLNSDDENLVKVAVKIETEEEIGTHIKYSKD